MLELLRGALETSIEVFPYFGFFGILCLFYYRFIEPYIDINKLKVNGKILRYGHALTFLLICLHALLSCFLVLFGFILMFKIGYGLDLGFFGHLVGFLVFIGFF